MKISILLPYKENYSPKYPGAVSLFIYSINKISIFKKETTVYGNTNLKEKFSKENLKDFKGKKKAPKIILGAVIVLILGALGLEATNNDFDLGSLLQGQSMEEARMERDESGNLTGVTTYTKEMCETNQFNCADFSTRLEAQAYFEGVLTKIEANTAVDEFTKDNIGKVKIFISQMIKAQQNE